MALARKCDICGKLYENYDTGGAGRNVNGIAFITIFDNRNQYIHELKDCCPNCMESIQNHIESLKGVSI